MGRFEFVGALSKNGIPYFTESQDELANQIAVAKVELLTSLISEWYFFINDYENGKRKIEACLFRAA